MRLIVGSDSPAASASAPCDQLSRPRAALICAADSILRDPFHRFRDTEGLTTLLVLCMILLVSQTTLQGKPNMNKSILFKRAWQLKSWNRAMVFGQCLRMAWAEFKAGACRVSETARIDVVWDMIRGLEAVDRLGATGRAKLASLYDEMSALRAASV